MNCWLRGYFAETTTWLCLTHYGRNPYSIRIFRLHLAWPLSVQFQQRDIALKTEESTSNIIQNWPKIFHSQKRNAGKND